MANNVQVKLTGVEALQKALRTVPDVVESHVHSVIMTTAHGIAARAQALVPVGETGLLKRSIVSNAGSRAKTGQVGISDKAAYYWRMVEFGTVKMQARPFFRPAFDQESGLVNQRLTDAARQIEHGMSAIGGRFL